MKKTFSELLANHNISDDTRAFGYAGGEYLTYGEVKSLIVSVKNILVGSGVTKGDSVALLSENNPRWGVVYLAVTSLGAVIVPILPDFNVKPILNILEHSGTKILFASEKQRLKLKEATISLPIIALETFEAESGSLDTGISWTEDFDQDEEDTAAILYTSGTTGNSKGVMLSHRNILTNVDACYQVIAINEEDRFLSVLPLAHTYECTLGLLFPFKNGSSVSYLKGAPSPRVLMDALAKVKPTMILSVPLLIEKIYRSRVAALFHSKKILSILYRLPLFRKILNRLAGKKLLKAFGGSLRFFGIGGAPLAHDVELFLRDSRFPYSIGYGLTETAPLLAGDNPSIQKLRSTGFPVIDGEIRIDSPDPATGVGEILYRGPNVMKGYYREPEMTAEVMTEDGWLRTGDLGSLGKEGRLYIRGRKKNLILGANGENIYPEEVESIINEHDFVEESLVYLKGHELVALIYMNPEIPASVRETDLIEGIRKDVNAHLNAGIRLGSIIEEKQPFEKTPSLKIKRYLYVPENP